MQPVQTVYTDQYAMVCPHDDCGLQVFVSVTRERGGRIAAIALSHPDDGVNSLTESKNSSEDSANGRRIRGQHKA